MFLNPKQAIAEGWIKGIANLDKQIQPNAIDFTLDVVHTIDYLSRPYICEDKSRIKMRPTTVYPTKVDLTQQRPIWELLAGRVFDGTSNVYLDLPKGVAALPVFSRSTFARNGIFIVSGLYDSGYSGHIGFTIYTIGGMIAIEPGTRIGQIAFVEADSAKLYAGGYNHTEGTHYTEQTQTLQ